MCEAVVLYEQMGQQQLFIQNQNASLIHITNILPTQWWNFQTR